ncbi:S-layer homology domain-containing protein [Paenibacillus sp. SI8]|uniref:S-layer homology domain-containing protein n=1 Tax=unclassified Paenibacillus TaxID=185978 RepID=UPI003465545F
MKLQISQQLVKKTFLIMLVVLFFSSYLGLFAPVSEASITGPIISTIKSGGYQGVTVDSSGNLYYVKSTDATKIYKLTTAGVESTFASLGSTTYQLVIDANDNIYAAATAGLKKVDPSGTVTTVTGPTNLSSNMSLAVDGSGNLYYSNGSLTSLYKVDSQGNVTTLATGFSQIMGVAANSDGNVYVSEYMEQVIKKIDSNGNVTVIAGTSNTSGYSGDGGQASNAKLHGPHNLAIFDGQLYIAEYDNFVVRKIDLTTATKSINTVAGTGVTGNSGDGEAASGAKLGNVWSLSIDSSGSIYVATSNGLRAMYTSGALSGTVQDLTNNPVSGATVTMTGGFTSTTATTDASGKFTFNDAFPGSKTLKVTASGFADGTATASVMSGMSHSTGTIQIGAHVTGVTLDQTSLSLSAGGSTAVLTATVAPGSAGNKSVTWTSSNSSVATVNNTGIVTPVAAGTATITATTVEGGYTASSIVTVSRMLNAPTGLTLVAGDGQVTLHWSASTTSGVVTYNVYKAAASGAYGPTAEATVSGVTYSYTATGLTNGTTYYFIVKARYDEGISGNSNESSTKPVSSKATLSSLNLSGITLDQTVSGDVYAYTATVPNNVSVTTVTYTTSDSNATAELQFNGAPVNNPINLSVGSNVISIVITAQAGTPTTYTANVTRASQPSGNGDTKFGSTNTNPAPAPIPTPTPTPTPAMDVFKSDIVKGDANVVKNIETRIQEAKSNPITVTLSDTKGHWAEKTIDTFIKLHVIEGYNDGTFKPDDQITRAEFAVILSRVFDIQGGNPTSITLKDVGSHWAKDAIANLAEAGVISGYEDGTFKPDNTITREEMVILLSRIVDINNVSKDTTKGNFDDLKGSYAANEIKAEAQAGIINGKADGKFDAKSNSTRAEALQIILNALKLNPQVKTLLDSLN